MAIHYVAPLSKRVRFSLPHNHIDRNSTNFCWRRPLLDNRTQLHPTSIANLQQHTIRNPTPTTTTLREGVLNETIPSAVSNTGATLHALLPSAPSIPTGIPSKVVFHLPNGTTAAASTVNNSFTVYESPLEVQTSFPPSPTILSSAPASLLMLDTPSYTITKRSTITRRPPPRLACRRMQCYRVSNAHATNCCVYPSSLMFGT
jgi:hypothetical protein